jgi:hypothetical protein
MATITIDNAKVEKIITGYGFRASETQIVKGDERKTYFTVWTKEPVTEGQYLTIEGDLSVKMESFTGRDNQPKQVAAIHVNNAQIMSADLSADLPF